MRPRIQIYLDKSASAEEGLIRGLVEVVEQGAGQWNRNKNISSDNSSHPPLPPQMGAPKIKGSPRVIKPMRVN